MKNQRKMARTVFIKPAMLDDLRRVSEYYEVPVNRLVESAIATFLATTKRLDGSVLPDVAYPIPAGRRPGN